MNVDIRDCYIRNDAEEEDQGEEDQSFFVSYGTIVLLQRMVKSSIWH